MKIVAIGGGNLSSENVEKSYNLAKINNFIVKFANKTHARLLYIGFNIRADFYFSYIKKIFTPMGVQCEYLRFSEFDNHKAVESKFRRADIIFLPGGNTHEYMQMVKNFGLDKHLISAANRGVVMAGISAGAIMCFELGSSDFQKTGENAMYSKVEGLALCRGLIAPHYSSSDRPKDLPRMLETCSENMVAFGIDECVALVVDGDCFEVVTSSAGAKVFKCYISGGEFHQLELPSVGALEELYKL